MARIMGVSRMAERAIRRRGGQVINEKINGVKYLVVIPPKGITFELGVPWILGGDAAVLPEFCGNGLYLGHTRD